GPFIDLLGGRAAGDAMILEAGESPRAGGGQVGFQIVEIEIEARVAIEIAVAGVAGIPFIPAPNLAGGIRVAAKSSEAVRGEDGREDGVPRLRSRLQEAVGVEDEPPQPCL